MEQEKVVKQRKMIANIITMIILAVGIIFLIVGISNNNKAKAILDDLESDSKSHPYLVLSTQSKAKVAEYQKTAKITIPIGIVICIIAVIFKLGSKSILLKDNIKQVNNTCKDNYNNLDELKKLKELLDNDAITQEEYDKKKQELLK